MIEIVLVHAVRNHKIRRKTEKKVSQLMKNQSLKQDQKKLKNIIKLCYNL